MPSLDNIRHTVQTATLAMGQSSVVNPLFSQTQMVGMFSLKMTEGLVSRQHPHLGHGLQIRVGSPRLNKTTQPLGLAQLRQDHLK